VELVQLETSELLDALGFDSHKVPFISGSALQALDGIDSELGKKSIIKLMNTCDTQIPLPERDIKSPFLMPIEKTVPILGRGQVLIGTAMRGAIKKNSPVELVGFGKNIKTVATDIQVFKNSVGECIAGDHVGILVRGVKPGDVKRGMIVAGPNSIKQSNNLIAKLYMLNVSEGGRKNPILHGYIQPFCSNTATIDCYLNLKNNQMLMGGEFAETNIFLKKPLPLMVGDRFTIRETLTRTSCTGVVTQILPDTKEEIRGFNKDKLVTTKTPTQQVKTLKK
jgi:elongation factor Tu